MLGARCLSCCPPCPRRGLWQGRLLLSPLLVGRGTARRAGEQHCWPGLERWPGAGGCTGLWVPLARRASGSRLGRWGRLAGSGRTRLTLWGCNCSRLGAGNGRIVHGLHPVSDFRPNGRVGPHVVSQPGSSRDPGLVWTTPRQVHLVRGLQDRVEADRRRLGGLLPVPFALASLGLAFSFALGRVEAIIGSLSLSFSWPLSCSLLHGCSVLGRQLPGQAGAVQAERGKGKA